MLCECLKSELSRISRKADNQIADNRVSVCCTFTKLLLPHTTIEGVPAKVVQMIAGVSFGSFLTPSIASTLCMSSLTALQLLTLQFVINI